MSSDLDEFGNRMKRYEIVTRHYLPRRTYTIVRVDGKAFSTLTKNSPKPFCTKFVLSMDEVAKSLSDIEGAQFSYVQSDEVSVLLTDFHKENSQAWFDGNLQKIASVTASMATMAFNNKHVPKGLFDSRVFTIPDPTEVANYFVWRTKDCIRNLILSLGQCHLGHKNIEGLSCQQIKNRLMKGGVDWEDAPQRIKAGGIFGKNFFKSPPTTDLYKFYKKMVPYYEPN